MVLDAQKVTVNHLQGGGPASDHRGFKRLQDLGSIFDAGERQQHLSLPPDPCAAASAPLVGDHPFVGDIGIFRHHSLLREVTQR